MGSLASLIVRIGANDAELSSALAKIGVNAKRADADLSKIGGTPLGDQALKSFDNLNASMKQLTDQQQRFADKAVGAAAGLETIGGAGRLMKGQLDEVATTINKGIDAFRALGQQAPKDLQRVADAVAAQKEVLKKAGGASNLLAGAQTALISQLAAVAGPAALGFAAKSALDYADNLVKLSDQTGIAIVPLQRLGAIAQASGNSLEDIAGAVNKFQRNLFEGNDAAVNAIQRIGVSLDDLRKQSPDEQFITIAKAIQKIPEPAAQAATAMEIFGRSGAQLLPTLKGDIDKLADSTFKMSETATHALDDLGDALGQLKTSAVNVAGEMVAAFIEAGKNLAKELGHIEDIIKQHLPKGPQAPGVAQDPAIRKRLSEALAQGPAAFSEALGATPPVSHGPAPVLPAGLPAQTASLQNLTSGLSEQLEAIDKIVNAQRELYGADLIERARVFVDALGDTANIERLTESQQRKLSQELHGALDVYRALGQTAPASLRNVSAALDRTIEAQAIWQHHLEGSQGALIGLNITMEQFANITQGFTAAGTLISESFDDMNRRAKDTEASFRKLYGVTADLSLSLPAGLAPVNTKLLKEAQEATDDFRTAFEDLGKDLPNILSHAFEGGGGLSGAIKSIATKMGADFAKELNDSIAKNVQAGGNGVTASGVKSAGALGALAGVGTAASGGSAGAAVGAVATTALGVGIASFAAATAAASASGVAATGAVSGALALGAATAGIGLAAVGAYFALKKLFADSEKEINPVRQAFVDAAGGLGELSKKAFEATGSLALVQNLLNAKNVDQYNTAVKALSDVLTAQQKKTDDAAAAAARVSDAVGGIVTAAQAVGTNVPTYLQHALDSLLDMKGLTDDERDAIKALASTGPDFDALTQTALGLGISIEQLGPVFQQQQIDKTAHQYQDAFDQLTDAGADVGGVLTGLSPKINDLLSDATKFGSSVPKSMQPMLNKMLELGLLTDDSGKKLDTLAGFTFDDSKSPLDKAVDKLTDAIGKLGDLLANLPGIAATAASGIGGALSTVHPEIIVDVSFDDHGGYNGGAQAAATGGLVTSFGIQRFGGGGRVLPFVPRGTDTVPAMLTPGEIVLNADQQAAVAAAMSQAGTSLSTAALERKLDALTRQLTDQNRRMPEAIAMQVKAAIAKAS